MPYSEYWNPREQEETMCTLEMEQLQLVELAANERVRL